MAIVELNDLMARISGIVGNDDESLALLDDVKDTFDSYTDSENWKQKYTDLDNEWRDKYKQRFTEGVEAKESHQESIEEVNEKSTFDELFEEVR